MRKGGFSKLLNCKKEKFENKVVFPFPAFSSISERVISVAGNSVTSNRASLNPEKVEDRVLNCGWVGVKSPKLFSKIHI